MVAEIELSKGNLDAGKAALDKVPPDKITDPGPYLNMGIILYNKKQAAAAEEAFNKALAVNADLADAYYYRALARLQLKRIPEAKADLKKYLELAPTGADAADAKELLKSF
jgi:tetratricopeptide (TPR) repeat protein